MMNTFVFNGKKGSDFGIYISGSGTYNFPERDVTKYEVPGRNGDLIVDNGRFKNIMLKYPAFIRNNFKENTDGARMWLLQSSAYHRLEDTYHPDIYRMARFSGPLDWSTRFLNRSGECDLFFDCKPQRFLKSGEIPIVSETNVTVSNPTPFDAEPLIRIYGTEGSLIVGNNVIRITSINDYIDIDSDSQNAFKGTTNCNGNIELDTFPVLPEGETGISFEGNITKIEIIPRWWLA